MIEEELSGLIIGKSIDVHRQLHDVHLAQMLTYLRLGNYRLGLLINFDEALL